MPNESKPSEEDCLSEEDAAKYLGVTLLKIRELWSSDKIDTYYVKTGLPVRKLGMGWEDHPDNELCYRRGDLDQLKQALEAEKKERSNS